MPMRMRSLPPVSLRASTTDSRQWSARTWADKSARIQSRRSCSRYANRQGGSDSETDEDFGWREPPDFERRAANQRMIGPAVPPSEPGLLDPRLAIEELDRVIPKDYESVSASPATRPW